MSFLSKFFGGERQIPAENFDLWQRVEIALERVRPMLQADGGDIELIDVTAECNQGANDRRLLPLFQFDVYFE